MTKEEKIGTLSLVGGVGLFSTVEVACKMIGPRVDPIVLTFIRFFTAGLLLLLLSLPEIRRNAGTFSRRDYGIFLLNGLLGITFALTLFHTAILVLDKAASSAVIFSITPVFVVILSRFINQETWSARKWLGVVLGGAGVLCFAYESGIFAWNSLKGLSLMVSAAFLFALSTCISQRMAGRYGVMVFMGFSAFFGSVVLLPLVLFRIEILGLKGMTDAAALVMYVTLCGTALAYVLYYFGLAKTSAQRGAMIFFLKPVLASLLAFLILGEKINTYMITGIGLILTGLILTGLFLELPRQFLLPKPRPESVIKDPF